MIYHWDEKLCIGVPHIDAQHRKLFQICERIMTIFRDQDEDRNRRAVAEAVKYLKNYTLEHFADEEAYQRSIGYADCEKHHQIHQGFVQIILDQERKLKESAYAEADVEQFVQIVNTWLGEHIMQVDQTIKPGN